jgi:peptidoglycan/LPS O-acetylase OafA/YrhL
LIILASTLGSTPIGVAGATLLVYAALARPIALPRVIVFGATISYGIFLWHHEILRGLRDAGLPSLGIVLGGIVLTLCAATASWYVIEKPANDLGRHYRRIWHAAVESAHVQLGR